MTVLLHTSNQGISATCKDWSCVSLHNNERAARVKRAKKRTYPGAGADWLRWRLCAIVSRH
jgi:hypothetical protein